MARTTHVGVRPTAVFWAVFFVGRISGMQDPAGRALATSPNARLEVAELDEDLMSLVQTSVVTGTKGPANATALVSVSAANSTAPSLPASGVPQAHQDTGQHPSESVPTALSRIAESSAERAPLSQLSLLSHPARLYFPTDPALRPIRYLLVLSLCAVLLPLAFAMVTWREAWSGDRGAAKALEVLQPVKFDGAEDTDIVDKNDVLTIPREADTVTPLSSEDPVT